jgi:hypothetical protein
MVLVPSSAEPDVGPVLDMLPGGESRRGTFTFTMEETDTVEELLEHEGLDRQDGNTLSSEAMTPAEDATIARLFQSPAKEAPTRPIEAPADVDYPELPLSDTVEEVFETTLETAESNEVNMTPIEDDYTLDLDEEVDLEEGTTMAIHPEAPPQEFESQEMEAAQVLQSASASAFESLHVQVSEVEHVEISDDIVYPTLPTETTQSDRIEPPALLPERNLTEGALLDAEMLESTEESYVDQYDPQDPEIEDDVVLHDNEDETVDEDFTEASLQLNILRDYQDTLRGKRISQAEALDEDAIELPEDMETEHAQSEQQDTTIQAPVPSQTGDITDGLTFSFTTTKPPSPDPTARKSLPSPPPASSAPIDTTTTIAMDDDKALLKDFLNRAAASKAEKAAVTTHRRESLQNRRDSDVVRHALASPRKVLEEKDPNSPSKYDNELNLDLSQNLALNMGHNALGSPSPDEADTEGATEDKSPNASRRSSRTKRSRLPAPASASASALFAPALSAPALSAPAQTSKISIRRVDGNEHVVLKKSDAQELYTLTRANTKKNKQGAFGVTVRLLKLSADAATLPPLDDSTKELVVGKNIRWDEQLAYYQENPETVAEAESLSTPDELAMPGADSTPRAKSKSKVSKNSTPKIRRVRGLGTANGTPGKGLLAPASLLPEDVHAETEVPLQPKTRKMPVASFIPAPSSTVSESKLPSLDIVPVGVTPTKERRSRLAAPKKVVLPQPVAALPAEGKENSQRVGIAGATPKKGIPAPKVVVPAGVGVGVGMESGLPRRRGRGRM